MTPTIEGRAAEIKHLARKHMLQVTAEAEQAMKERCAKVADGFREDRRTTTAYRLASVSIAAAIRGLE